MGCFAPYTTSITFGDSFAFPEKPFGDDVVIVPYGIAIGALPL